MIWLAKLLLKQKVKKLQRKVRTQNFSSAKTAVIIYDASQKEDEGIVRNFARFLKEEGLKVTTFGYYKFKDKADLPPKEELSYYYFTSKELNWLRQPSLESSKRVLLDQADLLIDLNINNQFCLQHLVALSKANFKAGGAGSYRDQACDLTIKLNPVNLDSLIKELKKYLAIINTKIAS